MEREPAVTKPGETCKACGIKTGVGFIEQHLYLIEAPIFFRTWKGNIERKAREKLLVCDSCAKRIDEGAAFTRPSGGSEKDFDAA